MRVFFEIYIFAGDIAWTYNIKNWKTLHANLKLDLDPVNHTLIYKEESVPKDILDM